MSCLTRVAFRDKSACRILLLAMPSEIFLCNVDE
jgi:hypothetical protein